MAIILHGRELSSLSLYLRKPKKNTQHSMLWIRFHTLMVLFASVIVFGPYPPALGNAVLDKLRVTFTPLSLYYRKVALKCKTVYTGTQSVVVMMYPNSDRTIEISHSNHVHVPSRRWARLRHY